MTAEVKTPTPRIVGHYFEFKRGSWVVGEDGKKQTYSEGGLSYVGTLTEAGKLGLDELINEYVSKEGAKTQQETEDVCAHRYYKSHCRICRIANLETELAALSTLCEQQKGEIERLTADHITLNSSLSSNIRYCDEMEAECAALRALLRKIRDGSGDLKVCCGNPVDGEDMGSFDHPPDPPQCCGEPEMLHDLIDAAIDAAKE